MTDYPKIQIGDHELRVPDIGRYYCDSAGEWCYLIQPSYEHEVATSTPVDSFESVNCAFAYFMLKAMEKERIADAATAPEDRFYDIKEWPEYEYAEAWADFGKLTGKGE